MTCQRWYTINYGMKVKNWKIKVDVIIVSPTNLECPFKTQHILTKNKEMLKGVFSNGVHRKKGRRGAKNTRFSIDACTVSWTPTDTWRPAIGSFLIYFYF